MVSETVRRTDEADLRGPRPWLAQAEYREQTDTREDCVGGKAENQARPADQSLYQSECDSEQRHRRNFHRPTDQTCFLHKFRLTMRLRAKCRWLRKTKAVATRRSQRLLAKQIRSGILHRRWLARARSHAVAGMIAHMRLDG